jgi:hypothetical protein
VDEWPPHFFRFQIDSRSFLRRAREDLARFDADGDVGAFFNAALSLRMGIEARLFEYIKPALGSKRPEDAGIKEFAATKLLARLTRLNPDAGVATTIVIRAEGEGEGSAMQYTPVTPQLAAIHGRLGELLHYNYFWKSPHWFIKKPWRPGSLSTLVDARRLLDEAANGLEQATRGSLLGHPQFKVLVDELEAEAEIEVTSTQPSPAQRPDAPAT